MIEDVITRKSIKGKGLVVYIWDLSNHPSIARYVDIYVCIKVYLCVKNCHNVTRHNLVY